MKEIIQGNSYFTLHFDDTVSAQMKKQYGLISVLLEESKEIKVRYLVSIMLGHAKTDTVVHEMLKTGEISFTSQIGPVTWNGWSKCE